MKVCRFLLVVLFLPALILLSGCWDYVEYEDMTLIDAVGFDSGPNGEVVMTVLYSPTASNTAGGGGGPGQGQGQSQAVRVIQVSSPTVACALDQLQQIIPKQLFLGNTRIVVIGNQVTPDVMQKIISFLDTAQYIRPATLVAMSKGKAGTLLAIQETTGAEPIPETIMNLIKNTVRNGVAISVSILQLLIALEREGIEPVLPLVELETQPESEAKSGEDNNPATKKPVLGLVPLKPGNDRISGLAVLKGFKFVGELDESESRGLAWIHSQKFIGHLCLNFSNQELAPEHPEPVSFRFFNIKTNIKMNVSKESPQVELKVKASGILEEFRALKAVLPQTSVKPLEQKIAAKIKQDLAKTVTKAQSLHSDIMGFGFELFRQHRKDWRKTYRKEWDRTFPELPIHIQVKVSILSTGTKLPSFQER